MVYNNRTSEFYLKVKDIECDLVQKKDFPTTAIATTAASSCGTVMKMEKKRTVTAGVSRSNNPIEEAMRDVSAEKKSITAQVS